MGIIRPDFMKIFAYWAGDSQFYHLAEGRAADHQCPTRWQAPPQRAWLPFGYVMDCCVGCGSCWPIDETQAGDAAAQTIPDVEAVEAEPAAGWRPPSVGPASPAGPPASLHSPPRSRVRAFLCETPEYDERGQLIRPEDNPT